VSFARLRSDESGYSLVELITVTAILSIVLGGLTTVFVQGSNAELDLNNRFQAQQSARIALDRVRREVLYASAISATAYNTTPVTTFTETLPSQCIGGGGSVTWCVLANPAGPSTRYTLYRQLNGACSASSIKWADWLTTANAFTYTVQSSSSLAKLRFDLRVNLKPSRAFETFRLADDIVLRNSVRSCIVNSPSPPC
jgi:prepilin-type N-terminal cleavage/methylation domain-containing protein